MNPILIFIAGVLGISWSANYLSSVLAAGDPALAPVGVAIGALGPLVMAAVLRKISGNGWASAGLRWQISNNKGWYAFSLVYTPLLIVCVAGLALTTGAAEDVPLKISV